MSGIAAVFDRSGAVSQRDFEAVFDALAHRGWDGADAVTGDRVAVGHHHAYTTPEEVGERQPVAGDGGLLALDGRLDNRGELFDLLDGSGGAPASGDANDSRPAGSAGSDVSDAELALRAYGELRESFVEELVGAFALVVWDPTEGRLLLATDRTDIHRQLYYADAGDAVVVASEMQALFEHPAVSPAPNERAVGKLLAGRPIPPTETFYADVRAVEPGSVVAVTADDTRPARYWAPWDADVERDPARDVAEEFRDRLEEAVACRLRAPELPGIQLSGGLDSTTIACVARRYLDRQDGGDDPAGGVDRPEGGVDRIGGADDRSWGTDDRSWGTDDQFHAFSLVRDDEDFAGERERIRTVVEACDLRSHTRPMGDHYTLKDVGPYEAEARESPVFNSVLLANRALYRDAADAGPRVLLTGIGGNMYDGNRFYYLDLLRHGRLGAFVRRALADPMAARRVVLWFVLVPRFDSVAALVRRRLGDDLGAGVPAFVDDDFARRSGLVDSSASGPETGFDTVSWALQYEPYYRSERRFESATSRRVALRAGVELRNPFMDSRLLSFLFSIPSWELFEPGRDKALVRRAMDGILPELVRTQSAAVHFDPLVDRGIRDQRRTFVEDLVADPRLAERGFVDGEAFARRVRRYLDGDEEGSNSVWRLLAAELWARQWL